MGFSLTYWHFTLAHSKGQVKVTHILIASMLLTVTARANITIYHRWKNLQMKYSPIFRCFCINHSTILQNDDINGNKSNSTVCTVQVEVKLHEQLSIHVHFRHVWLFITLVRLWLQSLLVHVWLFITLVRLRLPIFTRTCRTWMVARHCGKVSIQNFDLQ